MDLLKISTLGGLSIQLNNQPITGFISRKVDALLVYLAANPREHPRELLGEMLWDDLSQSRTMSYLRTTLSSLQKQLAPYLIVTRQSISINPESNYWLDINELETALGAAEAKWEERETFSKKVAADLETALSLYKGSFLEGFHIRSARGFEGWMIIEQERLHSRTLEALYRLGHYALEHGSYTPGIEHTSRALQLDPLWEEAHRQMMRLLAASGQRTAALAQYETCRLVLDDELGVEPEDETVELYEEIHSGEFEVASQRETPNNLPRSATPFVDRPFDIQRISEHLDKQECRLLTLVGPGGIGKSRLALEVGYRHLQDFQQGVFFVNFVSGRSHNVVNTIANALDLRSRHDRTAEEELIQYLQDQEILLILDNFDELLESADSLIPILEMAPFVKIIVTARERLNLQEEWLFNVDSLPVPAELPAKSVPEILDFPSIQLFDIAAHRMRVDFSIDDDLTSVVEICRLVRGVPLAIELAASWTRVMQPAQILEEIKQGLDILSTSLRNVPERHRSMRAVFESSWNQLTEADQQIFRRLSIFRGGFDQRAAKHVADATIFSLSTLVDKSLLLSQDGRYDIHELLRQFAEEKLRAVPDEQSIIIQKYMDYFATFMQERDQRLSYNLETSPFHEVLEDIDNIWAAWDYTIEQFAVSHIDQFLLPLYRFLDLQSRYRDAEHAFRVATTRLFEKPDDTGIVKYRAKILLGISLQHLTRFDEAQSTILESLPIIMQQGNTWDQIVAQRALGNIAYSRGIYTEARDHFNVVLEKLYELNEISTHATILFRLSDIEAVLGNYQAAREILERSRDIIDATGGLINKTRHSITLADIEIKMGSYEEAEADILHALELTKQLDAPTTVGVVLVTLGRAAIALGKYEEAITHCSNSIAICDEIRNFWGKAFALMHLGRAYYSIGEYAEAKRQFRLSLDICREINSRWIEAVALRYQGRVNRLMGNKSVAAENLEHAYSIAQEINARPVVMEVLAGLTSLLATDGHKELASQIAAYVLNEPVSEYETLMQIHDLIKAGQVEPGQDNLSQADIDTIAMRGFNTLKQTL